MLRPEVRIITPQQEEKSTLNISRSEEEALLAKYGYSPSPNTFDSLETVIDQTPPTTFEEMCRLEEAKKRENQIKTQQQMYGPKPITFEGDYRSESVYGSDDGFSYKINIVTNIR